MEIWKSVVGFERFYEVSETGRVRSLDRVVQSPRRGAQKLVGRELKSGTASTGYLTVALCRDGRPRSYTVHELVAAAFLGERPTGCDVDHIDGDRKNNTVANLRYVAHQTNARNITKINARSGELGVYPNGSGWCAMIVVGGATKYLGTYRTVEAAAAARKAYEREIDYRGFEAA